MEHGEKMQACTYRDGVRKANGQLELELAKDIMGQTLKYFTMKSP